MAEELKKEDRRVRRTKKLLTQALTELLQEKQVNEITVKELTDLADMNRGTFYLYYKDIFDMLEKNYDQYKKIFVESNPNNNWRHLDYIYNPAYFDKLIEAAKTNPRLAFSGHTINPLFYLLANAYIEGDSMESDILMTTPLAIIHPINNERIRSQHGVFTLFPFPSHRLYTSYNNLDYFKMENNSKIKGTLCKINILFPKKISEELKVLGTHKSWLFYEQDRISQEIESGL